MSEANEGSSDLWSDGAESADMSRSDRERAGGFRSGLGDDHCYD